MAGAAAAAAAAAGGGGSSGCVGAKGGGTSSWPETAVQLSATHLGDRAAASSLASTSVPAPCSRRVISSFGLDLGPSHGTAVIYLAPEAVGVAWLMAETALLHALHRTKLASWRAEPHTFDSEANNVTCYTGSGASRLVAAPRRNRRLMGGLHTRC